MSSAPVIHVNAAGLEDEAKRWFMDLEDVPDTPLHDAIIELLKLILDERFRERDVLVARNLGCRWDPYDARVGVDPDIAVIAPAPPQGLKTLRTWLPEHPPPTLAIEIVSETNADKDYREGPLRMARLGVEELWIFDPELHGPTDEDRGGPFQLQIWRRTGPQMKRIFAGDAPAHSPTLGAWLVTELREKGLHLRIAGDAAGQQLWPTYGEAQAQHANIEAQRANTEAQRADTEAQRANVEAQRANVEAQRADAEAQRAAAAEAELQRVRALLEQATSRNRALLPELELEPDADD